MASRVPPCTMGEQIAAGHPAGQVADQQVAAAGAQGDQGQGQQAPADAAQVLPPARRAPAQQEHRPGDDKGR